MENNIENIRVEAKVYTNQAIGLNNFAKVNCDARQHFSLLFSFSHAINIFSFPCRYVIKQLVHDLAVHVSSYGCTWGALESTREARVALGYRLEQLYASLVLSKLPACIHRPRRLRIKRYHARYRAIMVLYNTLITKQSLKRKYCRQAFYFCIL